MVDECRRQKILLVHENSLISCNNQRNEISKNLPIVYAKKALKQLQITGLKIDDIKSYFEDDTLETLDADMFLRFACDKTIQLEKSKKAFQLMDYASKGFVVLDDLQRVCIELEEEMTEEELIEMIEFADTSTTKDGILSPDDFFRVAHKVNL